MLSYLLILFLHVIALFNTLIWSTSVWLSGGCLFQCWYFWRNILTIHSCDESSDFPCNLFSLIVLWSKRWFPDNFVFYVKASHNGAVALLLSSHHQLSYRWSHVTNINLQIMVTDLNMGRIFVKKLTEKRCYDDNEVVDGWYKKIVMTTRWIWKGWRQWWQWW